MQVHKRQGRNSKYLKTDWKLLRPSLHMQGTYTHSHEECLGNLCIFKSIKILAAYLGIILSQEPTGTQPLSHLPPSTAIRYLSPVCRSSAFSALQLLPALQLATEPHMQFLVALCSTLIPNYTFCFPVQITRSNVGLRRCASSHMGEF